MSLPQQRERVTIDGLGDIGQGKYTKSTKTDSKSVANLGESGIIKIENKKNSKISTNVKNINLSIEQRNTEKGNPNAVLMFGVELNNRQTRLLNSLPEFDSKVVVSKKDVNMSDLSALTAKTSHEFAMFTKGNERLIIRGNEVSVNVDLNMAHKLSKEGYRWSGHTHPGNDMFCLFSSDGDKAILRQFKQKSSSIYNSKGQFTVFGKE